MSKSTTGRDWSMRLAFLVIPLLSGWSAGAAHAYPEYQQYIEKSSRRTVNCAMCHTSENGPSGQGPGQIGSLSADELKRLNKARGAMMPGVEVDSPILNRFGNQLIKAVGKKAFVEMKAHPEKLAEALTEPTDLDEDGITDKQEFLDGTDPLNKFHGDPLKLFLVNFDRYKMHILLAVVAVLSLNYGLLHLIKGVAILQERNKKV